MRLTPAKINNYAHQAKQKINPRWIVPAVVVGALGLETGIECKHAVKEDKKNALISNLLIGAAIFAGGMAGHKSYESFLSKPLEQMRKKTGKEKIFNLKDITEAFSIPMMASLFGGLAGEITEKFFPVKYHTAEKRVKKANNILGLKIGFMDNIDGFPGADLVDKVHPSFATISGYHVAKEKGVKNKVKKFMFEMVSGVVAPILIILPVAKKMKESPNKKLIGLTTVGAGVITTFIGNSIAKWFNKKVTDQIVEARIWKNINAKQRDLIKKSIISGNPAKKAQIESKISELQNIKKTIKEDGIHSKDVGLASTPLKPQD